MLAEVRSGLRHPGNGLLPHAVGYPPAASQIQCKDESFYPRTQEDRWVEGGHAEDGRADQQYGRALGQGPRPPDGNAEKDVAQDPEQIACYDYPYQGQARIVGRFIAQQGCVEGTLLTLQVRLGGRYLRKGSAKVYACPDHAYTQQDESRQRPQLGPAVEEVGVKGDTSDEQQGGLKVVY